MMFAVVFCTLVSVADASVVVQDAEMETSQDSVSPGALPLLSMLLPEKGAAFQAVPMRTLRAPSASVASEPRMALPSIDDARSLSDEDIQKEITNAKKELFELRKKVKTRQEVKPHLFTHTKHRVSQLQTLLAQRQAA